MKIVRLLAPVLSGLLAVRCGASLLLTEHFSSPPTASGWHTFGDASLFQWDAANHNLSVTWDSSKPNSYCYLPLPATFTRADNFLLAFDLRLADIMVGANPAKPFTFEIALGLLNTNRATGPGFLRGAGSAPDIVEFDYFPNDVNNYGATLSTLLISASNSFSSGGFTAPLELQTNVTYHVVMVYTAANQTLHTSLTTNGAPVSWIQNSHLDDGFDDFSVNALSINSYSDDGQFPGWEGSVLAHGAVDNVIFTSPPPVMDFCAPATGTVQFRSDTNWVYTLEQTTDLNTWTPAASVATGNGTNLVMQATNAPVDQTFFRVRADLP